MCGLLFELAHNCIT